MVFVFQSIEVYCEGANSYEDLLFDHSDCCKVISVFVPELSGAHTYSLSFILANNGLDEILVACIFVQIADSFFRVLDYILDKTLNFVITWHILQLFVNGSFDGGTCFLLERKENISKYYVVIN